MTEDRKLELAQLLQEALANLENDLLFRGLSITPDEYKQVTTSLVSLFKKFSMDCATLYSRH